MSGLAVAVACAGLGGMWQRERFVRNEGPYGWRCCVLMKTDGATMAAAGFAIIRKGLEISKRFLEPCGGSAL